MSEMSGFSVDCSVVEVSPGVFQVATRREADRLMKEEDKKYFNVVKQIPKVPGYSGPDYAKRDYREELTRYISERINRITGTKGSIDIQSLNIELSNLVGSEPEGKHVDVDHFIYDSATFQRSL